MYLVNPINLTVDIDQLTRGEIKATQNDTM